MIRLGCYIQSISFFILIIEDYITAYTVYTIDCFFHQFNLLLIFQTFHIPTKVPNDNKMALIRSLYHKIFILIGEVYIITLQLHLTIQLSKQIQAQVPCAQWWMFFINRRKGTYYLIHLFLCLSLPNVVHQTDANTDINGIIIAITFLKKYFMVTCWEVAKLQHLLSSNLSCHSLSI